MDNLLKEINDINTAYLILARSMLRVDKQVAIFRLGISMAVADDISTLSSYQILKLAKSNQLIFNFRLNGSNEIKALLKESRIDELHSMHSGIILSGKCLENSTI